MAEIPAQATWVRKLPCDVCGKPTNCNEDMFNAVTRERQAGELEVRITVVCSSECASVRMARLLALGD